jgi:hypothetical protein
LVIRALRRLTQEDHKLEASLITRKEGRERGIKENTAKERNLFESLLSESDILFSIDVTI